MLAEITLRLTPQARPLSNISMNVSNEVLRIHLQRHLARNVHIWHVLVFTEERQVEEDCQRCGVCRQDDDFTNAAVESLRCFVGAFLELAVVGRLLHKVKNLLREGGVSDRPSCCVGVSFVCGLDFVRLPRTYRSCRC